MDCILFFAEKKEPEKNATKFFLHYEGLGWMIKGYPIIDWQSIAEKWIMNEENFNNQETKKNASKDFQKNASGFGTL